MIALAGGLVAFGFLLPLMPAVRVSDRASEGWRAALALTRGRRARGLGVAVGALLLVGILGISASGLAEMAIASRLVPVIVARAAGPTRGADMTQFQACLTVGVSAALFGLAVAALQVGSFPDSAAEAPAAPGV